MLRSVGAGFTLLGCLVVVGLLRLWLPEYQPAEHCTAPRGDTAELAAGTVQLVDVESGRAVRAAGDAEQEPHTTPEEFLAARLRVVPRGDRLPARATFHAADGRVYSAVWAYDLPQPTAVNVGFYSEQTFLFELPADAVAGGTIRLGEAPKDGLAAFRPTACFTVADDFPLSEGTIEMQDVEVGVA